MHAIEIPRLGTVDVLTHVTDRPRPEPGPGEALIEIAATGVNQIDLVVRRGYPGITVPLPHVPGGDIAGTIAAVGPGVDLQPGLRVVAYPLLWCGHCELCRGGATHLCLNWRYVGLHVPGSYAQYAVVPAQNLVPLPDAVAFEAAACLPVAGLTAMHAVTTVAALRPGQTFLLWGGGGALGTLAIQLARALGARVIATAATAPRLELMRSLGADLVLDRARDDVEAAVRAFAPSGVDVVLDYVGPATFNRSFAMLKKGGKLLLCGMITGREAPLNIHMTYLRHLSVHGLYLGTMAELAELVRWLAEGRVRPHVGHRFPLAQAADAQRLMEAGQSLGKMLLLPDGPRVRPASPRGC